MSDAKLDSVRNLPAIILAGGFGTRFAEETDNIPKPLISIGGIPIIMHIMQSYAAFGVQKFIICLGYKGHKIKEYFANLALHQLDMTIGPNGEIEYHGRVKFPWTISLIDTGLETQTGGRLKLVSDLISTEEFLMTYGDGVADVDIAKSYISHKSSGCLATVTATNPPARFGALKLDGNRVLEFAEKPKVETGWVNGGFFVLNKKCLDYIDNSSTIFEQEPLINLARDGELNAYFHDGFWQPMDTLRDKRLLESLWETGNAPWKIR